MNDIEYQEIFTKQINPTNLRHLIIELENTYTRSSGWIVGKIITKKIDDNLIEVSTTLTKRTLPEDYGFRQTFVKVIEKTNLNNTLNEIYETYSKDLGYVVDDPEITELNDNEIIIRIPITKYEKSTKMGI